MKDSLLPTVSCRRTLLFPFIFVQFDMLLLLLWCRLTDHNIFIILYGVFSVYFAGVMVRLMLVLAPVMCILSGIAVSRDHPLIFNYLCTYDLYIPVRNVFGACISITRASGRGLGPGIREFFAPCEMASSR
jgi:hypothetical protein